MRREGVPDKIIPWATTIGFDGMGPLAIFFKKTGRRGIKEYLENKHPLVW